MWNDKVTQVHWEPTDKCNSGCAMCPRYDSSGFELSTLENVEWTLESFKKAWSVKFLSEFYFSVYKHPAASGKTSQLK